MSSAAWLPFAVVTGFVLTLRLLFRRDLHSISPRAAQALMHSARVVVLDVREPRETESGTLPGARLIPLSQLAHRLAEVPTGQILVYCASGLRSRTAAAWLRRAGHQEVWNLEGGLTAWTRLGYPLESLRSAEAHP